MKQASRIETTLQILSAIERAKIPMDLVIGDFLNSRRFIGSKDRADIANRIYDMVRHTARLTWWTNFLGIESTPRNRMLIWLSLVEDKARVREMFSGEKYAPDSLEDTELELLQKLEPYEDILHEDMPAHIRVECPEHHEEALKAVFGGAFEDEMGAMLNPAPLDLRVNTLKATREKVKTLLADDKVQTDETGYSPWGLRTRNKVFLSRTKAFVKGYIDIQDEGSQLIAHVCQVQPGMQVLDYCAGAGGKTLALAAAMQNKGRIVATDNDEKRLGRAQARLKRAGIHNYELRPLTDIRHKKWLRRQKGTFDVVLTDVPCSGSGTWRRNPDMRWRTYGPSLEELTGIQAEIMDKAAPAIKPGGRLVYATCSLFREENENQVEAFLERHDDFKLLSLKDHWPEHPDLKNPCTGPYMRLSPHRHNTDGFFAAVLVRG